MIAMLRDPRDRDARCARRRPRLRTRTNAKTNGPRSSASIAAQREALVSGDGERAFSFAAPSIRRHFGDVETFMRMVRQGYAALLDARYVEFLEGAVIGGDVVQPLRLVMADGTVLVAIYGVERQSDGSWRISSCVIAPSTVRSA